MSWGPRLPLWACSMPKTKQESRPHEKQPHSWSCGSQALLQQGPSAQQRWHITLHWKQLGRFAHAPSGKVHPACRGGRGVLGKAQEGPGKGEGERLGAKVEG